MNAVGFLLIALGGALGALARYGVTVWVGARLPLSSFPWGTFVINATGSFVLGFVATLLAERVLISVHIRPLVTIGFVGAYTTFSAYEYETARLGASWQAIGNLMGSVAAGYGCVWLGIGCAHWVAVHGLRPALPR